MAELVKTRREVQHALLERGLGEVSMAVQTLGDLHDQLETQLDEMPYERQESAAGVRLQESIDALQGAIDDLERVEGCDGELPYFKGL